MRITQIEVERFLGLRKVIVHVGSEIQIVAGPNNAGKSTLLRAVDLFFRPGSTIAPKEFSPQNEYYEEEGTRALTRIRLQFGELSEAERRVFAPALVGRSGEFWCEKRITRGGAVSFKASRDADGSETYLQLADLIDVLYIPAVRVGANNKSVFESQRLSATVEEILIKKRPGRQSAVQRTFANAASELKERIRAVLNQSKEAAEDLLPPNTSLDFILPDDDALLQVILSKLKITTRGNEEITVEDEGTGFQSLLSLGLAQYVAQRVQDRTDNLLLLIEEPEAFLHPHSQRTVAYYLKDLTDKSQLLVTTHSATVVDSVSIREIARLPRVADGLSWEWEPLDMPESTEGLLTRLCDTKNSEIVFADKAIFCEGITDSGVLRELIKFATGSHAHKKNVSVVDMGSANSAQHFAKLASRFAVPFLFVLDKDVYASDDRTKIRNLCEALGIPITQDEYAVLDRLKGVHCTNSTIAREVMNEANQIFLQRNVYVLSADMEYSLATSFSKTTLTRALGPDGLNVFSADDVSELLDPATDYYVRLRTSIGSKGWNTERANSNKPKPHILPMLLSKEYANITRDSDLDSLRRQLRSFLAIR